MKTKYAKLVVKDSGGNIIQLLPETKVDAALDVDSDYPVSNSAVATALTAMENAREVDILSVEPVSSNTVSMRNDSLILWNQGATPTSETPMTPVFTAGNQTIQGVKTFQAGVFGEAKTLESVETELDCSLASSFIKTIMSNTSFSFTNVPEGATCRIVVVVHDGGSYSVSWPQGVRWTDNDVPDLTANGTDVFEFVTCNGGNIWYGTPLCTGVLI